MMTGGAGVEDLSFVEENTFVDFYLVARMFASINLYLTTENIIQNKLCFVLHYTSAQNSVLFYGHSVLFYSCNEKCI